MGFLDSIFGGGKPKTTSTLTSEQKTLVNLLQEQLVPGILGQKYSPQYQEMLKGSKLGQGATQYQGQLIPDLLPQFGQALGLISNYNPNQYNQQNNQLMGALNGQLNSQPAYNAKGTLPQGYFNKAIINPMLHAFDTQIAPRINAGFAGLGAFSSRQGTALSNALSDLSVSAQQQYAQANLQQNSLAEQINSQSAENAANRRFQAIPMFQQFLQQQTYQPFQQSAAISSALQPFQQNLFQQSQAKYNDFLRTAPENNPWIKQALGIIGEPLQAAYNAPSPFGQVMGGLGSLVGLGSLFGGGGIGAGLGSLFGGGSKLGVGANGSSNIFGGGY